MTLGERAKARADKTILDHGQDFTFTNPADGSTRTVRCLPQKSGGAGTNVRPGGSTNPAETDEYDFVMAGDADVKEKYRTTFKGFVYEITAPPYGNPVGGITPLLHAIGIRIKKA